MGILYLAAGLFCVLAAFAVPSLLCRSLLIGVGICFVGAAA